MVMPIGTVFSKNFCSLKSSETYYNFLQFISVIVSL